VCYEQAQSLSRSFDTIRFEHVPREGNAQADRLANEALDRSGKST
jgi:ribonuclease HI/probable phosphoglycerate mutase